MQQTALYFDGLILPAWQITIHEMLVRRPDGPTFLSFFGMTDVRAYSGITTFQLCTLFPMTSQIEISTGLLFYNWFKEVN